MKIVKGYPPNIEEIRKYFDIAEGTVFTFGDTLYSPRTDQIPDHLMIHEETHSKQQMKFLTPNEWWNKYFKDIPFRLEQEVEAYQNQWAFYKKDNNRENRRKFLKKIAQDLSGKMYNNMISFQEAIERIKNEK